VSKLGKQSALPKTVYIVHVNKEAHLPSAGSDQPQLIHRISTAKLSPTQTYLPLTEVLMKIHWIEGILSY